MQSLGIRPLRLLAGLAVLAALLVPAYFLLIRDPEDPGIERVTLLDPAPPDGLDVGIDSGNLAPDFELSTIDGERVRLSDFRGRPLVVNFWATWCTSCLTEMPDLKALQQQKGLDTFSVLAVNAGETSTEAREFVDFLEAPFVYGMDPGLTLSDAYNVFGLPLSVFIDSQGIVRGVYRGHARPDVLETFVSAAIDAQPAGEVPTVLRVVTTIPRERTLDVSTDGPGNLHFASRSLRCDVTYCAEPHLTQGLAAHEGILDTSFSTEVTPTLTVDFDPTITSDGEVVTAVTNLLQELEDPVYTRPLDVQYIPD